MLNLLNTIKAYNSTGSSLLRELEEENMRNESFFREVENWRNVEQNYIAKIAQVVNTLRDKAIRQSHKQVSPQGFACSLILEEESFFCANTQLAKMLQVVIDNHKSFLSKFNYDIFLVNCESAEKMLMQSKRLLDEEKQQQKEIANRREQLQKVLSKRQKLRRQKEQEEMLQIFLLDSVDTTIDQKMRKKNKIKELEKEGEQFEIKVKETVDEYARFHEKNKESLNRVKHNFKQQNRCRIETLLKINLHLNTYWRNLQGGIDQYDKDAFYRHTQNVPNSPIFGKMERKQDEIIKKLKLNRGGFVENSLKLINDSSIEELLQYSRDRQVKSKIKRMMQSNDVNPEQTDQVSRQVKLIKKMLLQEQVQRKCVDIFKGLVNKSSRMRMNFVFILQFFRINSQFQIALNKIHCLHCLISEFLQACYHHRDSFVLKQLMILLMTYYVSHHPNHQEGEVEKIYIIHFFKKNPLWKDIQYWQSVLLQCIYLQKKNTINMMIVSELSNLSKRKELLQAERLAILNQMLMVVRNMVIFEFSEKEVKSFASRFIKLLRQDEKFQKDVFNTIEDAVKEETKLHIQQRQSIKDFYVSNLIRTKSEQYSVPEDVRRSYTG